MSLESSATNITSSSTGVIGLIALTAGISEPALRLFLSILAGYPLAAIYNKYIKYQTETKKHLYFCCSGLYLCIFNYGFESYHSIIAILTTYFLTKFLHKSKHLVSVNFAFHMLYLLIAYYFTESDDYDIKWTMPHCVMVLRLIGYGFDIADGQQVDVNQLSKDQRETAIKTEIPSLLELAGFTYFPASFLVGPQFPYARYKRFVSGEFHKHTGHLEAGIKRGALGILYLIIRQYGAAKIPDSLFMTSDFQSYAFTKKLFLISLWGKISLYKYISCWLLAEGALTCFGLSFVGIDNNGNEDWSGCSNVKLIIFETASKMNHYVQSFNVNTNHWVAQYVYKRLKFLGNRTISYAAALFFLALWHGFHTGYYVCFLLEYTVITFEKQFETIFNDLKTKYPEILDSKAVNYFYLIFLRIYTHVCMGWCLIPFIYLRYDKWWQVFGAFNYYGFIVLGSWFLGCFVYRKFFKTPRNSSEQQHHHQQQQKEE